MPNARKTKGLLLSLSVIALAACSADNDGSMKTAAPMPPITEMDAAMAAPAPQPLTASDTLTPVLPGDIPAAPAASGDAALEARMARLEQSVGALRMDYDRMMPAFASLNTTNERIQALLDQIEKETGKRPVVAAAPQTTTRTTRTETTVPAAPVTAAMAPPAMAKTPALTSTTTTVTEEKPITPAPGSVVKQITTTQTMTKPAVPAIQAASSAKVTETTVTETRVEPAKAAATPETGSGAKSMAGSVTGVRIGEHGTKTRLVFDLTSKTKPDFKYDLDNGEKLLLVDMPTSVWTGTEGGKPNSPLISAWSVQKSPAGGATVAVQLKKDARVLSTEFLKAEGKDPARLVLDIAAGG